MVCLFCFKSFFITFINPLFNLSLKYSVFEGLNHKRLYASVLYLLFCNSEWDFEMIQCVTKSNKNCLLTIGKSFKEKFVLDIKQTGNRHAANPGYCRKKIIRNTWHMSLV